MTRSRSRDVARGEAAAWGREGDARVRLEDGRDAWARGVVPGDVVTLSLRSEGKRLVGALVRVEQASADRIEPACGYVERCGGCPWMIASGESTRRAKQALVARAVGGAVPVALVASPRELRYRRRARLAFRRDDALRVGYRRARSNEIVEIGECVVLDDALQEALSLVCERLADRLVDGGELRFALGALGRPTLVVRSEGAQPGGVYEALEALVGEGRLAGAAVFAFGATTPALFGDAVERTPALDGGEPLRGTIDGFSQANDPVALAMAETVVRYAEPAGRRVLELHAGHGHLSLGLAKGARSFVALEQSAAACAALEANLRTRGLVGKILTRDAVDAPRAPVDVVVLDPPRTGAAEALEAVVATGAPRVVMASCDPRTLERDVRLLVAAGYRVSEASAFDMFPGTPHVEAVVRLDRGPSLAANAPRR